MQIENGKIVSQNGTRKHVIRTLDSYANIDYTFDESLVPNGIFREVYDYFEQRTGVPKQFIFTCVLAMFCGIVGRRVSFQLGMNNFKPHDYFTLIGASGVGKTTILHFVCGILRALEEEIMGKDNSCDNLFLYLYPIPITLKLRELIDLIREESEEELHARSIAEKKGKPAPKPKVVQRSGVAIIDGVSSLFYDMKLASNAELAWAFLRLWDGEPRTTMIMNRNRRMMRVRFEDTALTLLSASVPCMFVEYLPKRPLLDRILSRFQIVNAGEHFWRRTLLEIEFTREKYSCREIVERLKQFYQFVCGLSQSQTPVLVSDAANALDEQIMQMWYKESLVLKDDIAQDYMSLIDTRLVRYALLFSILECYDSGQSADAITMTGTAMQRAIEVCEFFKTHTLNFLCEVKTIKPKLFK